ncbi:hypothetical protein [Arthrobacter tumbae]|uniref:hypothetical protein n=1 Tax=Arthrobacter tumbae TaxID=163874 RepID=UPI00195EDA5B|nr:hypothetical protein [Arthrobacter tumbae]MBM7781779.1 hypothetical protein [Arthrobacter tumbae]
MTIEAPDSECDPRYGQNAKVQVTVTDAAGKRIIKTTAPMNDAGGFTYTFEVPAEATAGLAAVEAYPHKIDWCDDTGKNNRVSDGTAPLVRVSCAERIKPLKIISGTR